MAAQGTVGAGNYANPLRDVVNLVAERVDQGVDYGGTGPVYAIGNGTVENVRGSGWPGGVFIQYVLSDGPLAGQHVYVAEDITPAVSVGQNVTSSTILGHMFGGPSGIETGWANPTASMQQALGRSQWTEGGSSTADGVNFNQLLVSLGAPAGIVHGSPVGTYTGAEAGVLTAADVQTTAASGGSGCPEGDLWSFSAPGSSLPIIGSLAPSFTISRCQGRALLGGVVLVVGAGFIVLGLAVMAGGSKFGRSVIAAAPLVK